MTARVRLRWHGDAVSRKAQRGATQGLKRAAEHLLTESRARVPIEEGTLERSGVASVDESSLKAAVSFDGPYAVYQHERLDLRHDPGRTAKYLEGPALEERAAFAALIAAAVRRNLQ